MLIQKRRKAGLGRLRFTDARDASYPIMTLVKPASAVPPSKQWVTGKVLDQKHSSMCVAFAWAQYLAASPIRVKLDRLMPNTSTKTKAVFLPPMQVIERIYLDAQLIDKFVGKHDGSTVRAGAQVLQKTLGCIASYHWAKSIGDIERHVRSTGPVVMGTNWFADMDVPDQHGFIRPTGKIEGGHAWLVSGYNGKMDAFRMINSWGTLWGDHGRAWVSRADLATLLVDGGEACVAVECEAPPPTFGTL